MAHPAEEGELPDHHGTTMDVPEAALTRRQFGQAVLAALAGAALPGCKSAGPPEDIVPYVDRPPEITPGVPLHFSTATARDGYGIGLLVQSREGRPVKVEGNPRHPYSLGATAAIDQAALWDLYDPDRLDGLHGPSGPESFASFARVVHGALRPGGEGLHLLVPPTTSPILADLFERLRAALPDARLYFDPVGAPTPRWSGAAEAFGAVYETHRDLAAADVVLAVGADIFMEGPYALRAGREIASRRAIRDPREPMSRLYAVETALTVTGAYVDHRLRGRAHEVALLPAQVLAALADRGVSIPESVRSVLRELPEPDDARRRFVDAFAADALAHRGKVAVWVGERQPARVHVVGHALEALVGEQIVRHAPTPILSAASAEHRIEGLLDALDAGAVDTLVVAGSNPVYALPSGADFGRKMRKARRRVVLAMHRDETVAESNWTVPEAHFLESWGVLRAPDGTVTFAQPLIRPLRHGRTLEDVVGALLGDHATGRERVRSFAERVGLDANGFGRGLAEGLVEGSAFAPVSATLDWDAVARSVGEIASGAHAARSERRIELHLVPDGRVASGRLSNNGWLRETPEPMTKLVWDNAAIVSPRTASRLEARLGDVLALERDGARVELPVYVQPGQADDTIVAWPGYGRRAGGRVARRGGVDLAPLARLDDAPYTAVRATRTGRNVALVTTQPQSIEQDRRHPVVLRMDKAFYADHPHHAERQDETPPSLYPERLTRPHQWSMAVDLSKCTGCSACVVACMVENNIPVVGKAQVARGREMLWLRVDRYFTEDEDGRMEVSMQPMACQHCEKAPCEYVCPTAATVHSSDGLNQMIYNRCIGTRFCSNNCPYKVRRFNYFDWNRHVEPIETMRMNPDVTVRARGVMEKCTYCVQRLRRAESNAKIEGRPIADGEVQAACQQACPTRAIEFGLMSDESSQVSHWRDDPRAYGALNELGVRPRTRYLARIDNPNPDAEK